ncbi:NAD(P)-binding protein [Chloroflexus sp.]|uniref:NAD(P)-binding protein n=1 Tax=Chloroflexus sp. TaxID=1904827 RepID=UPI002ACD305E|nr:NAD(P)-binding protein [Chloroflexus sp.]
MPLPIAIIGAGPVGLAAAVYLAERGAPFVVLEAGAQAGAAVLRWGHVQMFTPWRYCVDQAAVRLLAAAGWQMPPADAFPTGAELVERYLTPLAALPAIAPFARYRQRVVAVARRGHDRQRGRERQALPFQLTLVDDEGRESLLVARAVIDASGTYLSPNPLGAAGVPAIGERQASARIFYGIPDVLGRDRARYANRRVLVAGSGHSAFNTLLDLAQLRATAPETSIIWVVRREAATLDRIFGGGEADALAARGRLGMQIRALVNSGQMMLVTGWQTEQVQQTADGLVVSDGQRSLPPVDEIVVCTGLRPDLAMLRELRLALDPVVEAPVALAPLIDPNLHSCGTVPPHGVEELRHPEPDFYLIGMKSYGRAPTFLLLTGYEQARSVTAALCGDWAAARQVNLALPETGVCSGPQDDAGACCSLPAAGFIELRPVSRSCC